MLIIFMVTKAWMNGNFHNKTHNRKKKFHIVSNHHQPLSFKISIITQNKKINKKKNWKKEKNKKWKKESQECINQGMYQKKKKKHLILSSTVDGDPRTVTLGHGRDVAMVDSGEG